MTISQSYLDSVGLPSFNKNDMLNLDEHYLSSIGLPSLTGRPLTITVTRNSSYALVSATIEYASDPKTKVSFGMGNSFHPVFISGKVAMEGEVGSGSAIRQELVNLLTKFVLNRKDEWVLVTA